MSVVPLGGLVGSPGGRLPGSRRSRSAVAVALLVLAGLLTAIALMTGTKGAQADPVPPAPPGWTTVFSDGFSGAAGSAPSSQNWFYDIGSGYGNDEVEHTTNSTSNVYLDGDGHLVIKATDDDGTWTSGRIESTRDDFAAPAGGKLELTASIEQPNPANGLGYWPAFWALGAPIRSGGQWPRSGEIDMFEGVNGLDKASQTFHYATGQAGHPLMACPGTRSTCQTGYHTYSVIIDRTNPAAGFLQFLLDGTVESTITEAEVGPAAWRQAVDHGFYLILDLAMGGTSPDGLCHCTSPTSATTSGASMSVGYVAVYEQGGNSTPTAAATATGQLTAHDGDCLSNWDSLNAGGNPVRLNGCDGAAGQQWLPYNDGTVRTQGGCLTAHMPGPAKSPPLFWYPCDGTSAQAWTRRANGELVNRGSGTCLTAPAGNTGTVRLEPCTGSARQQWTVP